jgi:hypothetical protein
VNPAVVALGVAIALVLSAGRGLADDESDAASRVDCGTSSLFLYCRLEGASVELEAIQRQLPDETAEGASLQLLLDLARANGVAASAIKADPSRHEFNRPAILHVVRNGSGHYLVVRPTADRSRVQVFDGLAEPYLETWSRFLKTSRWDGYAVTVVSRRRVWTSGGLLATSLGAGIVAGVCLFSGERLVRRRRDRRAIADT